MHSLEDTIAAIASAPGGAARGIVRLSGPDAVCHLGKLFRPMGEAESPFSPPSVAAVVAGSLRLPGLTAILPCEAYVWPDCGGSARSYTGQPVVEIHTLGSPPLLELALRAFCQLGARLAEPGEFTMRAFLAGRIDLTQAEAVLGVIDATNRAELDVALSQLAGGLGHPLQQLRNGLVELLAHVEAGFDFADEQLPFITQEELSRHLAEIGQQIDAIGEQMAERSESSHCLAAVLVGRPNTGKSSLFNALVGDRAAIVSDRPGTTRDYLTAELDLDGVKCRLIDTAGALATAERSCGFQGRDEAVESAAQSATREQQRAAQLEIVCLDATRLMEDWERGLLKAAGAAGRIVVLTKCDELQHTDYIGPAITTSSATGRGIESLRDALREGILACRGSWGTTVSGTAERCRQSIRLAGESIGHAREMADAGQEELVAAEIRVALDKLGKVVGTIYTDDVLDRIFSRFCVGK